MAKIGNESRLILKLVRERMEREREHLNLIEHPEGWQQGYDKCSRKWEATIASVVSELEQK